MQGQVAPGASSARVALRGISARRKMDYLTAMHERMPGEMEVRDTLHTLPAPRPLVRQPSGAGGSTAIIM